MGLDDSTLDVSVPELALELSVLPGTVGPPLELSVLPGAILPLGFSVLPATVLPMEESVLPGVVLPTEGSVLPAEGSELLPVVSPELDVSVPIVDPLGSVDESAPPPPPPVPAVEHIPASHVPLLGEQLVPSAMVVLNNVPIKVVMV